MGTSKTQNRFITTLLKYKYLYLMILPVLAYYIVFRYIPMYGILIGFMDYSPTRPFLANEWVGLKHFHAFFNSIYAFRLIRNTLMINVYGLIFGFPAPIILALMLNEVRSDPFRRTVQTISYLPHFISTVVAVGIVLTFVSYDGIINELLVKIGLKKIQFMAEPKWFYPIYIISGMWQNLGWNSIVYLSAISAIDPNLYEASYIDGASRFQQIKNITIPCIMPTITILLILQIGGMLTVGFEKVYLLYNPSIYETADVISTFVYRRGLEERNYSYSAAVGLFNSIVNFLLLYAANFFSRKYSESSLW
jgi:putative aldouronate transport system permease protein